MKITPSKCKSFWRKETSVRVGSTRRRGGISVHVMDLALEQRLHF